MITQDKVRHVEVEGALKTVSFGIEKNNITHITAVLRNMYSNPPLAVIREYAANALDAHQMIGCTRPIEIKAPTTMDPVFKLRDFGPGLDEQQQDLLFNFGSSGAHKRASNDQIGGFGIGCKCAFSCSDQFQYVVYHGGTRYVWANYLDETDNSKASLLSQEASSEPNGIEVIVPVHLDLVSKFQEELRHAFKYYPIQPVIKGLSNSVFAAPEPMRHGTLRIQNAAGTSDVTIGWRMFGADINDREAVVMGCIPYPLDWDQVTGVENMNRALLNRMQLVIPIGWIQPAPSREALQYSIQTKKRLAALAEHIASEEFIQPLLSELLSLPAGERATLRLLSQVESATELFPADTKGGGAVNTLTFKVTKGAADARGLLVDRELYANTKTCGWEVNWIKSQYSYAKRMYMSGFEIESTRHTLSENSQMGGVSSTGKPVDIAQASLVRLPCASSTKGTNRFDRTRLYLIRDTKLVADRGNTVKQLTINLAQVAAGYAGPVFFFFTKADDGDWAKWLDLPAVKDGSIEAIDLATFKLPEYDALDIETWFPDYQSTSRSTRRSSSSVGRQSYEQAGKLFVKYTGGSGTPFSGHWTGVSAADMKKLSELVYVPLDAYCPRMKNWPGFDPAGWGDLFRAVVQPPGTAFIAGIRKADEERAVKRYTGMIRLDDYLAREIQSALDSGELTPGELAWARWTWHFGQSLSETKKQTYADLNFNENCQLDLLPELVQMVKEVAPKFPSGSVMRDVGERWTKNTTPKASTKAKWILEVVRNIVLMQDRAAYDRHGTEALKFLWDFLLGPKWILSPELELLGDKVQDDEAGDNWSWASVKDQDEVIRLQTEYPALTASILQAWFSKGGKSPAGREVDRLRSGARGPIPKNKAVWTSLTPHEVATIIAQSNLVQWLEKGGPSAPVMVP